MFIDCAEVLFSKQNRDEHCKKRKEKDSDRKERWYDELGSISFRWQIINTNDISDVSASHLRFDITFNVKKKEIGDCY